MVWNVAAKKFQFRETDMSRGMPSMTALLGLLALAGYQNRDKLGELLKGVTDNIAVRHRQPARTLRRPSR